MNNINILQSIIMPSLYSFIASFAFCIDFNIRKSFIISASIGGLLSQVVFSLLEVNFVSEMLCYFIASLAITAYSEIMARILRVPVNLHLVVAVIPLVPGSMMYKSMITLINGNTEAFLTQAAETFGVAGSIAMGIFAVSSITFFFKYSNKIAKTTLHK